MHLRRRLPLFLLLAAAILALPAFAAPVVEEGVSYLEGDDLKQADAYRLAQCRMDLFLPDDKPGFATIVWMHGGGLTGGKRSFPELRERGLKWSGQGLGIINIDYRLSPKAEHPAYLEDAAAAVAWTLRHVAGKGGDPAKVFVGGHSAGGYLAAMIGMDSRWLDAQGQSNRQLAGLVLVSGQVTTHFLVKKLRGDTGPELRPIIDEFAPLYHVAGNLPPFCLVLGDRRIEYKNRVEENELMATSLRNLGHPMVEFYEMGGLDHIAVSLGAWQIVPGFVHRVLARQAPPAPPLKTE